MIPFSYNFFSLLSTTNWTKITEYDIDNTLSRDIDLSERNKLWQHPWHLVHRVRLHEELKRRAVSKSEKGTPVELRTGSRVVNVDPSQAIVELTTGETIQGDLVIGADGIHVSM